MKKKLLTVALCVGLALSLTACSGGSGDINEDSLWQLQEENEALKEENEQLKEQLAALQGDKDTEEDLVEVEKLITNVEAEGVCGANLKWKYGNGVLVISGSGDMTEFSENKPWKDYREEIGHIYLGEGVTSVPSFAFGSLRTLSYVSFPSTLTSVGKRAFESCDQLEEIDLSGTSVTSIGERAFSGEKMKNIKLPSTLKQVGSGAFNCSSYSTPPSEVVSSLCQYPEGVATVNVRVAKTYITSLMGDGVSVFWNGDIYTEDLKLVEALQGAGIKHMDGEDLIFDYYYIYNVREDEYTPEMGEIVTEED